MTQTAEAIPAPPKPLPIWASILIIIISLSGGIWIVKWYVKSNPLANETKLLGEASAAPNNPTPAKPRVRANPNQPVVAADPPAYVRATDNNNFTAHIPEAAVVFTQSAAGQPATIKTLNYLNYDFVPQEHRTKLLSARRIARDEAVQKSLKVTPEQVAKLRPLLGQIGMIASQADQDQLKAALNEYLAAGDKNAAQAKVIATLTNLANNSKEATKTTVADRAAKISAIITDEQWKTFDAMGK